MHFVLSWDISATGNERTQIEEAIKLVIKPYSWVRPLTTFYIIKVDTQEQWDKIFAALNAAARSHGSNKAHYVMSPLMNGGQYNGLLPKNLWDAINERTK